MKKYFILFVFSLIVISCNKKSVKNETIKNKNLIVKDSIIEAVTEVEEVPKLIFTVQIAALKNENLNLNNLQNIQIFQEESLTKYRLGKFETYKEAREYRKSLLNKYPDAFIQTLKNGESISIKEALNN